MVARIISRLWRRVLAWDGWYMFPFPTPDLVPAPVWFDDYHAPRRYTPITECTVCVQTESVLNRVI